MPPFRQLTETKGRLRSGGLFSNRIAFVGHGTDTDKDFSIVQLPFKGSLNLHASSKSDGSQHPEFSPTRVLKG